MGFLDDLLGSLGNGQGQGNRLVQLQAIWNWVQEQGGVEVLLQKFQQGGLGEILGSWLSSGSNHAIGSSDIQSAFGQGELQSLADKLGTDVQGASGTLADLLPQLIDKMSPQGQVAEQHMDLGAMVDQIFKK